MPSYVVKTDPALDQYVYWSTVTDSPFFYGDRDEMRSHLELLAMTEGGSAKSDERLARADEFGTSCQVAEDGQVWRFFSWEEDDFIYEQDGMVRRRDLWELCQRIEAGRAVADLLHPFEDDDL